MIEENKLDIDYQVVINLMQQLYPDQFARCVAEAKAIKLEEMLQEAQAMQQAQSNKDSDKVDW